MVKIKIRAKKDCQIGGYVRGDVIDAYSMGCFYVFSDNNGGLRTRPKDEFDIVEDLSPVRTVTRKEIVAGTYGNLTVYFVKDDLRIEFITSKHTSAELLEAAHILNQIAEALEDGTTL